MKSKIIFYLLLVSGLAQADNFFEKVKVIGFQCNYGKVAIELRSFEYNRILFLSENESGNPKYFEMLEGQCIGLIKNLGLRLNGKIFDLNFETQVYSRKEQVYVPPRNPCRFGRTKCNDEGSYIEKIFKYQSIETFVDGYRFFNEQKIGQKL